MLWVEAKDAANDLTIHWTEPTTYNFLVQNVTSTEAEKACCRDTDLFISVGMFSSCFSLKKT